MKDTRIAGYDFDTWAALARSNPCAFEKMRRAALAECLAQAPVERRWRLQRLQWRIDQERRLAGSPLAACERISRLMWRSILGRNGLRERLVELGGLLQGRAGGARPDPARVLPFVRVRD
jgi:hypothetical protein